MRHPGHRPSPFISRRAILGAAAGAAMFGPLGLHPASAEEIKRNIWVNVLCAHPPDPAPPGIAPYGVDLFNAWQWRETIWVACEPISWSLLEKRIEAAIANWSNVHDLFALTGWAPQFRHGLQPLAERLPSMLVDDLSADSLRAFAWEDEVYGVPFSLSLLTLFANQQQMTSAGISSPPATWDELKRAAAELTRDGRYGWVAPYGSPGGIGGVASQWMACLQQAGGSLYDDDGVPAFNSAAGVDALQLMIDLMPYTHPSALTNIGIDDATLVFQRGEAAMMMNWPFMWQPVQDRKLSSVAGNVVTAVLPAGPAGTASVNGADGWGIAVASSRVEQAWMVLLFFINRRVQIEMARATGWLPARLSALTDPGLQQVLPIAATVLEQSRHPHNSFITPDYAEVTEAIGVEIQRALRGEQTAAAALEAADASVRAIVATR